MSWNEEYQGTVRGLKDNGFPPNHVSDELCDTLFDVYYLFYF